MRVQAAWSALILVLVATGCGTGSLQQNATGGAMAAGAIHALPLTVAEAPTTINMPRRIPHPPQIYAVSKGNHVHIYSNQAWHGHLIDVYYVPRQNVGLENHPDGIVYQGLRYQLRSTANVQRLGQTTIQPNGSWSFLWDLKNVQVPNREPMFFLIRSDVGQFGLVRTVSK